MRKPFKRFKKLAKTVMTIVLAVALVVSGIVFTPSVAKAADKQDYSPVDTVSGNDLLYLSDRKPEGYDETSDENPYNLDKEERGTMVISTEELQALKWKNEDPSSDPIKIYEDYDFDDDNEPLGKFHNKTNSVTDKFDQSDVDKRIVIRSVSFDEGDTRKKDIAYADYNKDDKKVELWVSDAEAKTDKAIVSVDMLVQYDSVFNGLSGTIKAAKTGNGENFLNITSGDFDGDGVETIILASVWNDGSNGSGKNAGFIMEYKYDPSSSSLERVGEPYAIFSDKSKLRGINVAAGDLDGDGCDDLGVIDSPISGYSYSGGAAVVSIFKGTKDGSILANKICSEEQKADYREDGHNREGTFAGPAIDCGDIDGDANDELVVGGRILRKDDNKYLEKDQMQLMGLYDIQDDAYKARILSAVSPNDFYGDDKNGEYEDDHLAGDKKSPTFQSSVATVAFNGNGSAETIFFNGSLFDYREDNETENTWGNPSAIPEMFNKMDRDKQYLFGAERVQSVAVGNFNNDPMGHESIICSICLDTYTSSAMGWMHHIDKTGVISAEYQDTEDKTQTVVKNYISSSKPYTVQDDAYPHKAYYEENEEYEEYDPACQTLTLTSCDNDHDGLRLRYNKKDYVYTDPNIQAVLQAAPYFPGVQEPGQTAFGVSTTYGSTKGDQTTHKWNAGAYIRGEGGVFAGGEYAIKAGYVGSYTTAKEYGQSTKYTATFRAGSKNTVIINRTPIVSYYYDVWDNENNEWVECGITVPTTLAPVWSQLTVSDYNDFVDEYNEIAARNAQEVGGDYNAATMVKIEGQGSSDNGQYLLDNEGKPQNYTTTWNTNTLDNVADLSKGFEMSLDYAGSDKTIEWAHDESETESETWSHGFSFNVELGATFDIGVYKQHAGGYAGYEYTDGKTTSETTTSGHIVSGRVMDIKGNELMEKGVSDKTLDAYRFVWNFGGWTINMGSDNNEETPVFGYAVRNVRSAPSPGKKLGISYDENTEKFTLTWPARDDVDGFKVYQVLGDDHELIEDEISGSATSYTFGRDKVDDFNGNLYMFTISASKDGIDSVYYNTVNYVVSTGQPGQDGKDGKDGQDGKDGKDGIDGKDGQDGKDGKDGIDGKDGKDGLNGKDGKDGKDGLNGKDGQDGKDGLNGKDGANGKDGLTSLYVPTVSVKSVSKKKIQVKWDKVANATGYVVEYKKAKAKTWTVKPVQGKKATIKKLKKGKLYQFRVAAVRGTQVGPYSKTKYVLNAKTKIKRLSPLYMSAFVKWKKVKKATGYIIKASTDKDFEYPVTVYKKGAKKKSIVINSLNRFAKHYVVVTPYKVYKKHKYMGFASKKKKVRIN